MLVLPPPLIIFDQTNPLTDADGFLPNIIPCRKQGYLQVGDFCLHLDVVRQVVGKSSLTSLTTPLPPTPAL